MKRCIAITLCVVAITEPVMADSRDLVIDRMSRCYTLSDTRQYLECIYGAVQPLRSELGLPQAPQAATFASQFARPEPQVAYATQTPPVAPSARSALIPQQPVRESRVVSGVLSTVLGMNTARVAPEQFGLRGAQASANGVDHITARLSEYSFDRGTGLFSVTLDNGQIWEQQKGDEHSPSWKKPAGTYVATVSYGAMGTYNLSIAGERQPYKVQRLH